jgi:hypothetical protein
LSICFFAFFALFSAVLIPPILIALLHTNHGWSYFPNTWFFSMALGWGLSTWGRFAGREGIHKYNGSWLLQTFCG